MYSLFGTSLLFHVQFCFFLTCIQISQKNYTKKKKNLHDPDNHNGVITHLEPDILKCEVKWALGSIIMSKASGGDGIPVELFKS